MKKFFKPVYDATQEIIQFLIEGGGAVGNDLSAITERFKDYATAIKHADSVSYEFTRTGENVQTSIRTITQTLENGRKLVLRYNDSLEVVSASLSGLSRQIDENNKAVERQIATEKRAEISRIAGNERIIESINRMNTARQMQVAQSAAISEQEAAEQQRRMAMSAGVGGAVRGTFVTNAPGITAGEQQTFDRAINALQEYLLKTQVSVATIRQIWSQFLSDDLPKNLTGVEYKLVEMLQKIDTAQQQMGASFRTVEQAKTRVLIAESQKREARINQEILRLGSLNKWWAENAGRMQAENDKVLIAQNAVLAQVASKAEAPIKQTTAAIKEENAAVTAQKSKIDELTVSWKTMGRLIAVQLLHRAVYAIVYAFQAAGQQAIEFQKRIAEIQTISQQAQLSMHEWAKGLFELSNAWGLPILDQTEAAYEAISNQVAHGADVFNFMTEANKFAIISVSSVTDAVNLGSSAINAYNMSVEDSTAIYAQFFKTIELGRLRAQDIANDFGNVAVMASKLGISLAELNASLATITIQGMTADNAMTQLRGLFTKLLKPTKDMKELFHDIGVDSGEAAIAAYGFSGFLSILEERTHGTSTELADFVSQVRGLIAILALTGTGRETFIKDLEQIRHAEEAAAEALKLSMETSGKALTVELNKVKNFFLQGSMDILDTLNKMTEGFGGLLTIVKATTLAVGFFITAATIALAIANKWVVIVSLTISGIMYLWAVMNAQQTKILEESKKKIDDYFNDISKIEEDAIRKSTEKFIDGLNAKKQALNQFYAKDLSEITKKEDKLIAGILEERERVLELLPKELAAKKNDLAILKKVFELTERIRLDTQSQFFDWDIQKIDENIKKIESRIEKSTVSIKLYYEDLIYEEKIKKLDEIAEYEAQLREDAQKAIEIGDLEVAGQKWREIRTLFNLEKKLKDELFHRDLDNVERIAREKKKSAQEVVRDNFGLTKHDKEQLSKIDKKYEKEKEELAKERAKLEEKLAEDIQKRISREHRGIGIGTSTRELLDRRKLEDLISRQRYLELANKANVEEFLVPQVQTPEQDVMELAKMQLNDITAYLKNIPELTKQNVDLAINAETGMFESFSTSIGKCVKILNESIADTEYALKLMQDVSKEDLTSNDPEKRAKGYEDLMKAVAALAVGSSTYHSQELQALTSELILHESMLDKLEKERQVKIEQMQDTNKQFENIKKQIENLQEELGKNLSIRQTITEDNIKPLLYQIDEIQIKIDTFNKTMQESGDSWTDFINPVQGFKALRAILKESDIIKEINDQDLKKNLEAIFQPGAKIEDFEKTQKSLNNYLDTLHIIMETYDKAKQPLPKELVAAFVSATQTKEQVNLLTQLAYRDDFLKQKINNLVDEYNKLPGIVETTTTKMNQQAASVNSNAAAFAALAAAINAYNAANGITAPQPIQTQNRGGIIEYFARGGRTRGRDTVPAMLTPGEFVMNAASTSRFYSQLVAMNNTRSYGSGGSVTHVGDINISMQPSRNESYDVVRLGKMLRREIRRGTV